MNQVIKKPKMNFYMAFDLSVGSSTGTCKCGRVFYNDDGTWSWDEGELEELKANKDATLLGHSVHFVRFENNEYVSSCDCWHQRANVIQGFIDTHLAEIADYINAEIDDVKKHADHMLTLKVRKNV